MYSYFLLFLSILIGISSTSVLNLWFMMELNTILFLSILMTTGNVSNISSLTKYFFIQATSSVIMIFSCFILSIEVLLSPMMIQFSMILKLGAIPGHMWYISIIQDLSWTNFLLISTVQKILPLFMLKTTASYLMMFFFIMISSFASIMAFLSPHLKIVFAYSSVMNLAWMMASSFSWMTLTFFFWVYFFTSAFVYMFFSFKAQEIGKYHNFGLNSYNAMLMSGMLLSLGGLPPFINFWTKLLVLKLLAEMGILFFSLGMFMVVMTIFLIYVYLNLINKWMMGNTINLISEQKHNSFPGLASFMSMQLGIIFFI